MLIISYQKIEKIWYFNLKTENLLVVLGTCCCCCCCCTIVYVLLSVIFHQKIHPELSNIITRSHGWIII